MTKQKDAVILARSTPHKSAELFRQLKRPTLINVADEWLAYDDAGAYRYIEDDDIDAEVQRFLIAAKLRAVNPETNAQILLAFNPKRNDVGEVYAALKRLCHRERLTAPCWLTESSEPRPEARNVIACRNGLLDVSTGELHSHTPDFFTRHALPIDYTSAAARPVQFFKFLREVTKDRNSLAFAIQEMMGYYLTSDTEQEVVHYLLGKSRGGKGTLMKIIAALVGPQNMCAPTIRSFANDFWAWPLRDKSLAMVTDMAITDRDAIKLAANHINMISGRDPVDVNRKHKDPITAVTLPTRVLMAGNYLPDFGEHAVALTNRLLVIPFDVSFKGREDRSLARRMIRDELPGILVWCLAGLRRLRERKHFLEPAESIAEKRKLVRLANPVLSFIEESCIVTAGASVAKDTLYTAYKSWCERAGVRGVLTRDTFALRLYETVPGLREFRPRIGGRQVPHFNGLRIDNAARGPMPAAFDFEREVTSLMDSGFSADDAVTMARQEANKDRHERLN